MKTKPRTTRALMATALCAAAMLTGSANAALWTYDSTAGTIRHDTTPWVLNVSRSGSELTITSVRTPATSLSALPLGDTVSGGYSITAIAGAASEWSGVFYEGESSPYHIQSLTLPSTLKTIGSYAFSFCSGLTDALTIPDSVTSINSGAFIGCIGLTGVTIGNRVTSIGSYAFAGCSSLTGALTIPDSVTRIGGSAFYDCSGLTGALTIGNSVTSIADYAFYNCSGLTGALTIPDSVTFIGNYAFQNCSGLTGVTIPDSVTFIGGSAFRGCSGLTNISVATANTNYESIDGVLFNKGATTLIFCPAGKTGTYSITNSVISIDAYAFQNCNGLTGVTIGNSVTSIGSYAFASCSSLANISVAAANANYENIDGVLFNKGATTLICCPVGKTGTYFIPASVTSIGNSAFSGCSGLTGALTIPDSVTNIGNSAFSSCSGLTGALTIGNNVTNIGNSAFSGCSSLTGALTIPDSVTSIGNSAFSSCSGLTGALTIGNSVTSIGNYAFQNCRGLTGALTIPDSVTNIGDSAFQNCSSLTGALTIGNNVTNIGYSAFSSCRGLTGALTIPDSVTRIGAYAFYDCRGLTGALTIPDSVTSIGGSAFSSCIGLTGALTIGNKVTSIGDGAFSSCSGLTGALTIGNNVTNIGNSAFSGCSSLTGALTIPDSVTSIGNYAFSSCRGLTGELTIGNSVISIGNYAFFYCSGLTGALTIPDSVTSIGYNAFYYCSGLTGALTIPNSVTSIGNSAFSGCSGLTGALTIPNSVTSIGNDAFSYCSGLTNISVETANPNYKSIDGVLFNKGETTLICCPAGKTGTYSIPNSVTSIGDSAFQNCRGLTGALTIPDSVTNIGDSAFQNCIGLTGALTIPDSVTSIGNYAFYNCSGLTGALTIGNNVTSIGNSAFRDCSGLTGALTIPDSVTSIDNYAFQNCSGLTGALTIGNSVTSIGNYAFQNCRGLTNISVATANTNYESIDGVLFNKGATTLICCPARKTGTYSITNSVTSIGNSAFYGCSDLTSVTIGNSVTSIGDTAFADCRGLTSVTIPGSVTSIGYHAFSACWGLTGVIFEGGSPASVGSDIFNYTYNVPTYIHRGRLTDWEGVVTGSLEAGTAEWQGHPIRILDLVALPPSLSFSPDAGSRTLAVSSAPPSAWNVTKDAYWLTVSPSSGSGNNAAEVTVTAEANMGTASRSATITVFNGEVMCLVPVTQAAANLTTSPSSLSFDVGGESRTFSVSANVSWTVTGGGDWLTVAPASGANYGTVTVTAPANPWADPRVASLTVTGGGITRTVTVTQAGAAAALTVGSSSLSLGPDSGSETFFVMGNVSWTATSSDTWLAVTPETGLGSGTVTVVAPANPLAVTRSATVTITGNGITRTVTVTQAGAAAALEASPATVPFSDAGGSQTFTVSGTVPWTVTGGAPWVTVSPTSGSGNGTVTVTAAANTSTAPRGATLTVSGGGFTRMVSVTQAGVAETLDVDPPFISLAPDAGSEGTLAVSGNVPWTAEADGEWLAVAPAAGTGNGLVTVTATANTNTEPRIAAVTVTGGGFTRTVAVTQEVAVLTVSVPSVSLGAGAGSAATVGVSGNVAWMVEDDAEWLGVTPGEGAGNGTITVTATANMSTAPRTASVTVFGCGITNTVSVTQAVVASVTVTFYGNGGTPGTQAVAQAPGSAYALPAANPTREGHVFAGWWTGEGGTGSQVFSNTIVGTVQDHALYAKWVSQSAIGSAVRAISRATAAITVTPAPGISAWGYEETIPAGLTPSGLTGPNAYWNAGARKISWYATSAASVTLGYTVSGADGSYTVGGMANFDGLDVPVSGVSTFDLRAAHPADVNADWQMIMGEAVAYLLGWQQDINPMNFAIRAAYLWQRGPGYGRLADMDEPLCWDVAPMAPAPLSLNMGAAPLAAANDVALTGSGVNAVRTISGATVTISMTPPAGTVVWGYEERIPAGLTPSGLTGPNAYWNDGARKISWYAISAEPVTLGYTVTGADGTYTVDGMANFDGADDPVSGDTQIVVGTVAPQPVLSVTPASQPVSKDAGTVTFNVANTGSGAMAWTAAVISGGSWARIISGEGGSGEGIVTVGYDANPADGAERTATIRVTAAGANGSPMEVTVVQAATPGGGNTIRTISGTTVIISMAPPAGTTVWGYEETIPFGLTPSDLTGPNAYWNAGARKISWYAINAEPVTLGYTVTGADGTYTVDGMANFDGADDPVSGDTQLVLSTVAPPVVLPGGTVSVVPATPDDIDPETGILTVPDGGATVTVITEDGAVTNTVTAGAGDLVLPDGTIVKGGTDNDHDGLPEVGPGSIIILPDGTEFTVPENGGGEYDPEAKIIRTGDGAMISVPDGTVTTPPPFKHDPYLNDTGNASISPIVTTAYAGFVYDDGGAVRGTMTLSAKMTLKKGVENWTFTAKAVLQNATVSFSGKDTVLPATLTLKGKTGETLSVTLGAGAFHGMVFGGKAGGTLRVAGARDTFADKKDTTGAATRLNAVRGYYTAALIGADGTAGYLTLTVGNSGSVKIAGKLADGTAVSGSAKLIEGLNDDRWLCIALHKPLYSKKGSIGGLLWLSPSDKVLRVDTDYGWFIDWVNEKPGTAFSRALDVCGGWYGTGAALKQSYLFNADVPAGLPAPVAGLDFGAGWMAAAYPSGIEATFASGKFTLPKADTLKKPAKTEPQVYDYSGVNPSGTKLSYTAKTGIFKGNFKLYYDGTKGGVIQHKAITANYVGILTPTRDAFYASLPLGLGTGTVKVGMEKAVIAVELR